MTEVPEHLLARSKARRSAMSGDGGGDAAPAAAPATTEDTAASTPAPAAAATPAEVVPAGPVEPEPVAPYVEAALTRKKIPYWAVPVLFFLPLWAIVYALTLDPPTPKNSPLTAGAEIYAGKGCAGCHGASGGGSGNIPALNGDENVAKVWPTPAQQVAWIALGSAGWLEAGNTAMENGKPVNGGMPGWSASLTPLEIMEVTLHERVDYGQEPFDAATWEKDFKETIEKYLPDQAAEYEAVLEEWKAQPPA